MTTEGIDVRSVGNTLTLHETALIEAFNLKAAIEYQLKNCELLSYVLIKIKLKSTIPPLSTKPTTTSHLKQ
jgi:tetratricopeptide repeat protein 30